MNRAELLSIMSPKPCNWESSSTRSRNGLCCVFIHRDPHPKILVYIQADLPQNLEKEFSYIQVVLYIFVFIFIYLLVFYT